MTPQLSLFDQKFEIDFLILRDKKIYLPIEVKLTDEQPSTSWAKFMNRLQCSIGIQLVMKPNIHRIHEYPEYKILILSAAAFLQHLI